MRQLVILSLTVSISATRASAFVSNSASVDQCQKPMYGTSRAVDNCGDLSGTSGYPAIAVTKARGHFGARNMAPSRDPIAWLGRCAVPARLPGHQIAPRPALLLRDAAIRLGEPAPTCQVQVRALDDAEDLGLKGTPSAPFPRRNAAMMDDDPSRP